MTTALDQFVVSQVHPHLWPGEQINFVGGARKESATGPNVMLAVTNLRLFAIADGQKNEWHYRARNAGVEVWELKHLAKVDYLAIQKGYNKKIAGPKFGLHCVPGTGPRPNQAFFVPLEANEFSRQADLLALGPQLAGAVDGGAFPGATPEEEAWLRQARAETAAAIDARRAESDDRSEIVWGGCLAVLAVTCSIGLLIASFFASWSSTYGAWHKPEDYVPLWMCSGCCCALAPAMLGGAFFIVHRRRKARAEAPG